MISVVVLTQNEESNIQDCLKSIRRLADEIILIDDSSDNTVEFAKKTIRSKKLKIYTKRQKENFAGLRNFGLKKAKYSWVLFVDGDHRVSAKLAQEIKSNVKNPADFAGFKIKQEDFFLGRKLRYGETAHIYHLLLAKKTAGKWQRQVHEKWIIEGKIKTLANPIYHYPHQSISEFISHINRWSTIDAKVFVSQKDKGVWWKLFLFPPAKFIRNYFFRLGFMDGLAGLIVALMMSLHSLMVRIKMITLTK